MDFNVFITSLTQVIITLLFIIPGFILCKWKKESANHLATLSRILVYICGPCMIVSSFIGMGEFKWEDFKNMGIFFAISLLLQALFILVLFLIFKNRISDAKYRIFTIGSVMGNVGYFGLPLVSMLVSDPIVSVYSCLYVCSMNIIVFTFGVYALTLEKKYMSVKEALINPSVIGLVIALILYFTGFYRIKGTDDAPIIFGKALFDAIALLGKTTTPICMIVLGVRLATVDFLKLFKRPFVYLTILTKMIIFPAFCYFTVRYIPFLNYSFKASILILSATPCAAIVLNLAEMHHKEEELSANTVLLTTLVSFITIPLMTLLLNV
jgi:predicted permease